MFLVVNHTVFSDRRSTNSKKTDVETSKPSLTQFHKFSSIEIPLLPSINTCINFNVYVVISEAFIMYSLQVQVESVQSSVLIYWQQSCTHIFFHQWINSRWNKEFHFIIVRQHTPVHQVTTYKQWLISDLIYCNLVIVARLNWKHQCMSVFHVGRDACGTAWDIFDPARRGHDILAWSKMDSNLLQRNTANVVECSAPNVTVHLR